MPVRLSSNESPFGPSPAAVEAATALLAQAHRYPDDASAELRAAIAVDEGVTPEQVTVGTGSAALLMDLIGERCAGYEAPEVVAFARAFVVYRLAARNAGATYVEVATGGPARGTASGYARDVDALLAAVTSRTRVVAIDNPANPTAAHVTAEELVHLASRLPDHVTLLVDEAYHHFATGQRGYARVGELQLDHEDVVVATTFSKAHALAGLRVGALLGPPAVVAATDGRRPRFNVAAAAQAAALASLSDPTHLAATVQGTVEGRRRLSEGLHAVGVAHSAGLGNFVTVELGRPAGPVVADLAARGIGVRALTPYGLEEQVRITVGTPAEVDAVLAAAPHVLDATM